MKIIYVVISALVFAGMASSQTTLMSTQQWNAVMKGWRPAIERSRTSSYRQSTKIGSYEDGDINGGYMGYITFEQDSHQNSRIHRVEHLNTGIRSEEILRIGKEVFTRMDNGRWATQALPTRTMVVKLPEEAIDSPYTRKPGAEEILYYSLGERPYKGLIVSVYEEVTRHVLVRKADNSEIHYENRTRFWISGSKEVVRYDTYYAIFDGDKTTRMFTSNEWELDSSIRPFEAPTNK